MRVALIGAGFASRPHVLALHELGHEVVTVVTRREDRARNVQFVFPGAKRCWPASEALDAGVDFAIVASPTNTHLEVVTEAAARKVDLLCEKPLGANNDQAIDLVRIAREAGIGLAVCFQHRAKPGGRALHDLVRQGTLGQITGGFLHVPWWREQSYYDDPGRGTFERDGGGALMVQGIHSLDLVLWVLGMPRRVVASGSRSPAHKLEAEDVFGGILDYGDFVITVHATTAAFPGREEELWLTGTKGTAVQHGAALDLYQDISMEVVASGTNATTATDPTGMPVEWHRSVIKDAIESFAEGREPLASGESALLTQRVVAALYRSVVSNSWETI
ncbi:Gfo/Idh/MocA family protein [Planotetraspora sp. GP83]|uniref:Gfo/Idh/MocA family protein n=1 Tax=Planotetraspora sp. GP83 TaxID=3156264 RepID=UPI003513340A